MPKALKRKRARRIILRLLAFFALSAALFAVLYFWGESLFPFGEKHHTARKVFYTALMLLPFFICRVPFKFIDSSWSGTVVRVDVDQGVSSYLEMGQTEPYWKMRVVLTVEKSNGKLIKRTARSFGEIMRYAHIPTPGKIEYHAEEFSVGDKVHKYYLFEYLFVSNLKKADRKRCIECGSTNGLEDKNCWSCGSALIELNGE